MVEIIILLFFWVFGALAIGASAECRNRSGVAWALLAVVISPVWAAVFLAFAPAKPTKEELAIQKSLVECPHCAEQIQSRARACRWCGRDVVVAAS